MSVLDLKILNMETVIHLRNIYAFLIDRSLRQLLRVIPCRSCRRLRSFDLLLQKILVGKQRRRATGVQEDDRAVIEALPADPV
ncbi:hypothetical protein SAMN04490196_4840 [Pseudomonas moraviensis]|nr:hypothetical protein SAMN04490196_4840 [Pseudomonas moraviensis]